MTSEQEIIPNRTQAAMVQSPDLSAALDWRERNLLSSLNCVSIGKIETFYPETQTADITIAYKRILTQQIPDGTISSSSLVVLYPKLCKCPVVVLGGGPGSLTFPIAAGDECLVMFCDRDIDLWYQGNPTSVPNSDRMHDWSDAIVIVGLRSMKNSLQSYNPAGPTLNKGGVTGVTVALEDKIRLQVGQQTLYNALNSLCDGLISTIQNLIQALITISTHTSATGIVTQITQIEQLLNQVMAAQSAINGVLK